MDAILSHIPATPFNRLTLDFMLICDRNYCAAKILGLFEAWTAHRYTEIEQSAHKNTVARKAGKPADHDESTWLYNTAKNIAFYLLGEYSESTVKRALTFLQEKGFIKTRNSPYSEWDRTKQYQLQVEAVQTAIDGISEEQIREFYGERENLIKPQTICFVNRGKTLEPCDTRALTVSDRTVSVSDRTVSVSDLYIYTSIDSSKYSLSPLTPQGESEEGKQTKAESDRQPIAESSQTGETIISPKVEPNPCATIPSDQESVCVVNQDSGSDQLFRAGSFEPKQLDRGFISPIELFENRMRGVLLPWQTSIKDFDPQFLDYVSRQMPAGGSMHPTVMARRFLRNRQSSQEGLIEILDYWEPYQQELASRIENEQRKAEAQHTDIVEDTLQIDGNALRAQLETSSNPIKKRILSVLDKLED